MSKKVFVSYVDRDRKYKAKIELWEKRGKFGTHEVEINSRDTKEVLSKTGRLIRGKLIKKIAESDFIIVIVGNRNHDHPWLKYEGLARKLRVQCYYMRIPYTKGTLPKPLKRLQQIAYNPNVIDKLLRDIDVAKQKEEE